MGYGTIEKDETISVKNNWAELLMAFVALSTTFSSRFFFKNEVTDIVFSGDHYNRSLMEHFLDSVGYLFILSIILRYLTTEFDLFHKKDQKSAYLISLLLPLIIQSIFISLWELGQTFILQDHPFQTEQLEASVLGLLSTYIYLIIKTNFFSNAS